MKVTKRPTLFEITAALAKSGYMDTATALAENAGVTVEDLLASRMNKLIKPKYVREKVRSAYLYPKQAGLTEQEQKDLLVSFVENLQKTPNYASLESPDEAEGNFLRVILPGNRPIWSYKIGLDDYHTLCLDQVVSSSPLIGAYVRKPRADVQDKLNVSTNHD